MSQTIVVTGARAPVALHLARLFRARGHRVILADTFAYPMARGTRSIAAYEKLPPPRHDLAAYATAWHGILARYKPHLVIPACEEVFYLAAVRDLQDVPLPLFAPSFDLLAKMHNKFDFSGLAQGFGADPPSTVLLRSQEDMEPLRGKGGTLVLKPVWSRFGARVLITPSDRQLKALKPTPADPWIAQTYLPGEELCVYAAAVDGIVVALQAYRPLYRAGPGASVAFKPISSDDITPFVEGVAAALRWTGHIGFDFKRDASGKPHAIECNPRPTSGAHFFGPEDGLPDAIMTGVSTHASERRAMTLPLAMATYGFRDALRQNGLGRWARDFAGMGDIAFWPGEGRLIGAQLLALGEIILRAAYQGTGLRKASTEDIEWNGERLDGSSAPVKAP